MLLRDPGSPSATSPWRLLCIGFWIFDSIAVCFLGLDEAVSSFRECGLSYGLCDALCTLQSFRSMISLTSSTTATLGMSGCLDLAQLGLAPNQKHQAFLGAPKIVHCGLPQDFLKAACAYVKNYYARKI